MSKTIKHTCNYDGKTTKHLTVANSRDVTVVGNSVVDGDGAVVPAQIVKTGDWPDGSLRWVLVDFTADFDKTYALEHKPVPASPRKDDISIAESADGITVTTVRKVLARLQNEDKIYKRKGLGSFVKKQKLELRGSRQPTEPQFSGLDHEEEPHSQGFYGSRKQEGKE